MSESNPPNERGQPPTLESRAGSAGKPKRPPRTRDMPPPVDKATLDARQQQMRERRRGPALPPDTTATRALAPEQPRDVPPTETTDADDAGAPDQ